MRLFLIVAVVFVVGAVPAQARIVYTKGGFASEVWTANDDGSGARFIASGTSPAVSPDGRWIAYVRARTDDSELRLVASSGRKSRAAAHATTITDVKFSPDSRRLAAVTDDRLVVYELATHATFDRAHGTIHGYSFAPDSHSVVYGKAAGAGSDLFRIKLGGHHTAAQVTHDRRSLNPLWSTQGIVFDKQTPAPDGFPRFELFALDGGGEHSLNVQRPEVPLTNGLVPLARSADGSRLLTGLLGQSRNDAYAVELPAGTVRAFGAELVPGGLSRDGSTVLLHTLGVRPDPGKDVIAMPWAGGPPVTLVHGAFGPRWSR
jgi:Tol biopolymer transport system component